jgi:hypothetical protein
VSLDGIVQCFHVMLSPDDDDVARMGWGGLGPTRAKLSRESRTRAGVGVSAQGARLTL